MQRSKLARQLSTLAVVRDVYHSRLYTRAVQGIISVAGPSHLRIYHVLYAKFAMKLSATVTPCWEGVVSCGEATHRDFELKLIYNVQCLQANRL